MKTILFFFISLITIQIYSQEAAFGWGVGEIYVGTHGIGESELISYKMQANGSLRGGGPLANLPFIFNPTNPSYTVARVPLAGYIGNTTFSSYNWPYFRMI